MDFTVVDKEESVEEKMSLFICTKCDFKKKKKKEKSIYDFLHFTCILFPLFLLIARIYGRLVVWPLSLLFDMSTYKPL